MANETQSGGELFGPAQAGQGQAGAVEGAEGTGAAKRGAARVLLPNRKQMELRASDLESLLPEGHRARVVW